MFILFTWFSEAPRGPERVMRGITRLGRDEVELESEGLLEAPLLSFLPDALPADAADSPPDLRRKSVNRRGTLVTGR